jgi:uncharacterized protein YlxW (UPF0749 family)
MTTTSTTKKPRTKKTPAQRAQEALDVEQRRVDRLTAKREAITKARTDAVQKGTSDLAILEPELQAAIERRDWCAESPDLPKQPAPGPSTGDKEPAT